MIERIWRSSSVRLWAKETERAYMKWQEWFLHGHADMKVKSISEKSNIVGKGAYKQTMEDQMENKIKEVVRDVWMPGLRNLNFIIGSGKILEK